ncbi:peptidase S1 and S6 chymotrypsin/Hap [Pseudopedobacter saltans DSM 12145]|uniref:Peptidase S1 and S6 chymotrypsin/Hap n=1 Tax=Pseudopedobacter saltans (strain ATCC 51119 / DSM 12145 / JCM 21818 / CCUG 39354 / LMG 10337 / NBRC 100064 / NCIMB 13643) TaxID=762903 RepID=F0S6I2_PSESL|nr:serine protease [Pseudopedobacter saltans]ADY51058.1 peptidase S1 and S6 chymotrypsin/Hap [Pseudopedobacter saltans DSM 12145]
MVSELDLIKRIESYLLKEMCTQEMLQFEEERKNNAALDQKVVEHIEFLKSIKSYGDTKSLKSAMNAIHEEIDVISLKEDVIERKTKIVELWNKYKRNLTIAATVAVVTTLGTLYSTGQLTRNDNNPSYSALKRDMETIRKSHNALVRNINSKSASKSIAPSQFGGTGFALTSNGYIVTNYHVVQGADSVYIQNNKGESFKTQTVYVDPSYDIAVLYINDPSFEHLGNLPYTFKKSLADLGEDVYTIGYPRDEVVLGKGYLSARTGFGGDSIQYQVSIPVNPGNSGGPLFDAKGNVIGVISGKQNQTDGAAFAIKSDYILKAVESIDQDSIKNKIVINKKNALSSLSKTQQIKKMQDYIFMVKVYNN